MSNLRDPAARRGGRSPRRDVHIIVKRTQIYLTRREDAALARASKQTGRTRSELIREAIDRVYLGGRDTDDILANLRASAGAWGERAESGVEYVERARPGRLARLHRKRPA